MTMSRLYILHFQSKIQTSYEKFEFQSEVHFILSTIIELVSVFGLDNWNILEPIHYRLTELYLFLILQFCLHYITLQTAVNTWFSLSTNIRYYFHKIYSFNSISGCQGDICTKTCLFEMLVNFRVNETLLVEQESVSLWDFSKTLLLERSFVLSFNTGVFCIENIRFLKKMQDEFNLLFRCQYI